LQKEWKPGVTAILEELEGIGCLSTDERRKKDIVQLYNHYSTTRLLMSAVVQDNSCDYADYSYSWNEFEIVPS